ncbi:MAG: MFS transporter [Deltaproteobacteria bacterium]|nr:MFS transporter [Deltaproteobacteria bacterium]
MNSKEGRGEEGSDSSDALTIGFLPRLLARVIDVRPEEMRALGWSWLYIFSVLFSYYILRPIRDEMGVAGGVENLQWLFTGTLLGMLVINPPFAALVARLPRVKFIAVSYRFFLANLLLFALLLHVATAEQNIWIGRLFFIWLSVFNLFVVSIFWAMMVDVFDAEQGKRLFGFIAAGATLGGIVGSILTASLARQVAPTYLLLISALLLEAAVFCVARLAKLSDALHQSPTAQFEERPIGGSAFSGLSHALSSSYLINVSGFILLFAITSTFLYFQQAEIAKQSFIDRGARTAFFARVDLWVNILTLGAQLFLTGRVLRWFGVAVTLAALPLLSIVGFGALALAPTITVLVVYQVARRASNFAFARPTREVLFTVVPREDKYKAKSFIDTVVYRLGDQVGAWSYAGLRMFGLGMNGIAIVAVPISLLWLLNGLWLGRRQQLLETGAAPRSVPAPAVR